MSPSVSQNIKYAPALETLETFRLEAGIKWFIYSFICFDIIFFCVECKTMQPAKPCFIKCSFLSSEILKYENKITVNLQTTSNSF